MRACVVEMNDGSPMVTLHKDDAAAMAHAVNIAVQVVGGSKVGMQAHLEEFGNFKQGDYEVHLAWACESAQP